MKKTILIVKNITHEGPGLLENVLFEYGIASNCVELAAGAVMPDPINYSALVILGGPQSANDETPVMQHQLKQIERALHAEIPYLGICLGMQILVKAGGGKVKKCTVKEIGFLDMEGHPYRIELTDADLREAAGIIREGARVYRESVVIPFVRPQVEAAMAEAVRMLAAAGTDNPRRFPVLLAEATERGASYSPAGVADLIEGPLEDDDGGVYAVWEWIPESSGAGYDGLLAAVMSQDSCEECGRGVLRKSAGRWTITVDHGRMDLLADATGYHNPIILFA